MKDGRPVRTTMSPLMKPIVSATGEGEEDAERDRHMEDDRRQRDHHAGEADHRADRKVEFAANHQQRRADGDDHQLPLTVDQFRMPSAANMPGAARRDAEEDKDQNQRPRMRRVRAGKGAGADRTGAAVVRRETSRRSTDARRRSLQPCIRILLGRLRLRMSFHSGVRGADRSQSDRNVTSAPRLSRASRGETSRVL